MTDTTPSPTAGIGAYSLEQFSRAVRAGRRRLYPGMPYTAALYAYFMHAVPADDTVPQRTALPFPFNARVSMLLWNWLFPDTAPFEPDRTRSAEWNRGAYLVQGLAHCGTCHTPRNFLMGEKPELYLRGASLGTWHAPQIAPGTAGWDHATLVDYLRTGHAANGATAGGPMREAVDKSFSKMAPRDIAAMATYLVDLPRAAGARRRGHRWRDR